MNNRNYLTKWNYAGNNVRLQYLDGSILHVSKKDFDRAFGCIVSLTRDEVERDFAIQDEVRHEPS